MPAPPPDGSSSGLGFSWRGRRRSHDIEGFIAGRPALEPFEVDELGPLGDLRLAHLQCGPGVDTLDLVRLHPGLAAVGLDPHEAAVAAATELATRIGLSPRCTFVQGDVMQAATVLATLVGAPFDVVYTGKGALAALNDLDGWATQCLSLLRPGGFLYVSEFHPLGFALSPTSPAVGDDYFRTDPWVDPSAGSTADAMAWNHPLPSILGALLTAGFDLRFFHEWDHTLFQVADWLVQGDDGRWRWPPGGGRLPLMFSLKAYRPA